MHRTAQLPPDEKVRLYWAWVLSIYGLRLNQNGNVTGQRMPAFRERTFCQAAWLELMNIKWSTFGNIKRRFVSSRDVVRNPHGQVGQ